MNVRAVGVPVAAMESKIHPLKSYDKNKIERTSMRVFFKNRHLWAFFLLFWVQIDSRS